MQTANAGCYRTWPGSDLFAADLRLSAARQLRQLFPLRGSWARSPARLTNRLPSENRHEAHRKARRHEVRDRGNEGISEFTCCLSPSSATFRAFVPSCPFVPLQYSSPPVIPIMPTLPRLLADPTKPRNGSHPRSTRRADTRPWHFDASSDDGKLHVVAGAGTRRWGAGSDRTLRRYGWYRRFSTHRAWQPADPLNFRRSTFSCLCEGGARVDPLHRASARSFGGRGAGAPRTGAGIPHRRQPRRTIVRSVDAPCTFCAGTERLRTNRGEPDVSGRSFPARPARN